MRTQKAAEKAAAKYTEAGAVEVVEAKAKVKKQAEPVVLRKMEPIEMLRNVLGEVDEVVDEAFSRKVTPKFNMTQWLKDKSFMTENLVDYITDFYGKQRAEVQLALDGDDDQLVEGYSYLTAAHKRKIIEFFDSILAGCEEYNSLTKRRKILARKPRVKRPISASKQVKKLKYLKESEDYNLVSIQPEYIVGATQLWTFNIQTKKLTQFIAADRAGLQVKGSVIINFDTKLSVTKNLRKPQDVLKVVLEGGKVERRKLMESIKAKASVANGRVNAKTIIIKMEK